MSDTLSILSGGSRRQKIHDATLTVKLPSAAKRLVQRAAADRKGEGWGDSDVVREALAEWFAKRGYGTEDDNL